MSKTYDKKDPAWVCLKDELQKILNSKNWEEATVDDIKKGTDILDEIYGKILELNRKEALLSVKYNNDAKYLRLHKELCRRELSKNEEIIYNILIGIKNETDERLLNSDILNSSENFFKLFIQRQVALKFKENNVILNAEVVKFIASAIVKEYLDERQGFIS